MRRGRFFLRCRALYRPLFGGTHGGGGEAAAATTAAAEQLMDDDEYDEKDSDASTAAAAVVSGAVWCAAQEGDFAVTELAVVRCGSGRQADAAAGRRWTAKDGAAVPRRANTQSVGADAWCGLADFKKFQAAAAARYAAPSAGQ